MKILVVCTGNRCRSQMAQGILQSLDPDLTVCSAGNRPDAFIGTEEEVLPEFRRVRDEIKEKMTGFLNQIKDRQ